MNEYYHLQYFLKVAIRLGLITKSSMVRAQNLLINRVFGNWGSRTLGHHPMPGGPA